MSRYTENKLKIWELSVICILFAVLLILIILLIYGVIPHQPKKFSYDLTVPKVEWSYQHKQEFATMIHYMAQPTYLNSKKGGHAYWNREKLEIANMVLLRCLESARIEDSNERNVVEVQYSIRIPKSHFTKSNFLPGQISYDEEDGLITVRGSSMNNISAILSLLIAVLKNKISSQKARELYPKYADAAVDIQGADRKFWKTICG